MQTIRIVVLAAALAAGQALGAVVSTTVHGPESTSLNGSIEVGDLLSGLIGVEQTGDLGWHSANNDAQDQLPAFTDDEGIRVTGLTGLLNDNEPAESGRKVKLVRYDLGGPKDIGQIKVLTGNNGKDSRVFSTFQVLVSTDGTTFTPLGPNDGYYESDPSGTLNENQQWGSTLVTIFDDASPLLAAGITHIQFDFWSAGAGGLGAPPEKRDPFDGVNPFTGVDDGLPAANTSPLVFEIDVVLVPEPASLALLGIGGLLLARRRRVAM